jgi:hypothetical protein
MSESGATSALRERLTRHNRSALLYACLALAGALVLWAVLFGVFYWIWLLGSTVSYGLRGQEASMPESFALWFAAVGCGAVLLVAVGKRMRRPRAAASPSSAGWMGGILDFALLLPRLTLSIPDNLSTLLFLSEEDLAASCELLEILIKEGPRRLETLPAELPDPDQRERILFALQLVGCIQFRHRHDAILVAAVMENVRPWIERREVFRIRGKSGTQEGREERPKFKG